MKTLFIFISLLFISGNLLKAQTDTLIDTRDNQTYKTIQLGNQTWMAENLRFKTEKHSYCYAGKPENCKKYGRLYSWDVAVKACPEGWHLATDKEWQDLEKLLGMPESDLAKSSAWRGSDQATKLMSDTSICFYAPLGGYHNPPSNNFLMNQQAFYWTSTDNGGLAWYRQIRKGSGQIFRRARAKSWAMSVRCVKDK